MVAREGAELEPSLSMLLVYYLHCETFAATETADGKYFSNN